MMPDDLKMLTAREREVATAIADGLPNKLICRTLGISEGTVKIHLHNIYQKLGITGRTMLALLIIRAGKLDGS
jgi:DNA-binding NarL/FixJ family response regulator